jgi:hypothetical protein
MPAAVNNLIIEQGASFECRITWKAGTPPAAVNLSSFTARMQVRVTAASPDTALSLTSSSGITLGGAAGTIDLFVSASGTAALAPGKYVYDLELVSASGNVTRLMAGTVTVTAEVTR